MLYGGMLLYGYVVRVARVDYGMLYGGMLPYFNVVVVVVVVAASWVYPPGRKRDSILCQHVKQAERVFFVGQGS